MVDGAVGDCHLVASVLIFFGDQPIPEMFEISYDLAENFFASHALKTYRTLFILPPPKNFILPLFSFASLFCAFLLHAKWF